SCTVAQEDLLENAGLFNLYAIREHAARQFNSELQRTLPEFTAALRMYQDHTTAPLILCVCPPSPTALENRAQRALIHETEQSLLSAVSSLPNVHAISFEHVLRQYPLRDYYDPHGQRLGHIPYTPEGFAAIGTALSRTMFTLNRAPFKVIVLDCDNTLWK